MESAYERVQGTAEVGGRMQMHGHACLVELFDSAIIYSIADTIGIVCLKETGCVCILGLLNNRQH